MSSGFHARLAKINFEKIASKDFLPRLPPKEKQKIMDVPTDDQSRATKQEQANLCEE